MADAKKCNRCAVLFEPKVGDLVILDLHEYTKPNNSDAGKADAAKGKLWQRSIYTESENECDLCSNCSASLRNYLKPIQANGGDAS